MSDASPGGAALALAEAEAVLARLRAALPPTNEPLRMAARRLRWFRAAFLSHLAQLERENGQRFEVNETALAAVFIDWLRALAAQRPSEKRAREDFVMFSAALALREFCRHMPLKAINAPLLTEARTPEEFWPEGHAAASFCLALLVAAEAQEFGRLPTLDPLFVDLRSWWSFKENARRDPSFAAGFLQAVIGRDPNWYLPDIFRAREGAETGT